MPKRIENTETKPVYEWVAFYPSLTEPMFGTTREKAVANLLSEFGLDLDQIDELDDAIHVFKFSEGYEVSEEKPTKPRLKFAKILGIVEWILKILVKLQHLLKSNKVLASCLVVSIDL